MAITVYEKPACIQCRLTKKWLDERGIEYEIGDALDPGNLEAARSLGIMAAPVVVTDTDAWGGFQPELLAEYAEKAA